MKPSMPPYARQLWEVVDSRLLPKGTAVLWMLCFSVFAAQAQTPPVLGRSVAPLAGDTPRYALMTNPSALTPVLSQNGASRIWDLATLLTSTQSRVEPYLNATQTPYFLLFGNYGKKTADSSSLFEFLGLHPQLPLQGVDSLNLPLTNLYDFYNLNNNRWAKTAQGIGLLGLPIPIFYSDADELLAFPLRYGDRDTSTFAFSINVPTLAEIRRQGQRFSVVDAWGTLRTPYGQFNCLRIRSRTTITDSILLSGSAPVGLPTRTEIETSWYSDQNNERGPILRILERGILFFPPTIQEVWYRDRYRVPPPPPPPPLTDPGNVVLYPNPCRGTLYLGLHPLDPCERVRFWNASGQEVLVIEQPGPQIEGLEFQLAAGFYRVEIQAQYGLYSKKILLIP
ncbi:MAG: T9SS type A sorting domain-containing protein [Bacteroidia bacterium]